MPILKYQDETVEVVIGKGDVAILPDVDKGVPTLSLFQMEGKYEVGEARVLAPTYEPTIDVKLVFLEPDTIDILIAQLIRAKAKFSQQKA